MMTTSQKGVAAPDELANGAEPRRRQKRELGVAAVFATRWRYAVPPVKTKKGAKEEKDGSDLEPEALGFAGTWFEDLPENVDLGI